jgi:hypothetical protein
VSTAYATGNANSDDYASTLRQVDPNTARHRLGKVRLVELNYDHQPSQFWRTTVTSSRLAEPADARVPAGPIVNPLAALPECWCTSCDSATHDLVLGELATGRGIPQRLERS